MSRKRRPVAVAGGPIVDEATNGVVGVAEPGGPAVGDTFGGAEVGGPIEGGVEYPEGETQTVGAEDVGSVDEGDEGIVGAGAIDESVTPVDGTGDEDLTGVEADAAAAKVVEAQNAADESNRVREALAGHVPSDRFRTTAEIADAAGVTEPDAYHTLSELLLEKHVIREGDSWMINPVSIEEQPRVRDDDEAGTTPDPAPDPAPAATTPVARSVPFPVVATLKNVDESNTLDVKAFPYKDRGSALNKAFDLVGDLLVNGTPIELSIEGTVFTVKGKREVETLVVTVPLYRAD